MKTLETTLTEETKNLKTTQEVAERIGVDKLTLETWRRKKKGPPFIRISRSRVRYDESAVQRWLDARTVDFAKKAGRR